MVESVAIGRTEIPLLGAIRVALLIVPLQTSGRFSNERDRRVQSMHTNPLFSS